MKIKTLKFRGDGSSLWGQSNGIYSVNRVEVNYVNWASYPEQESKTLHASVSLFGPNTHMDHYTDNGIERSVRKNIKLIAIIRAAIREKLKAALIARKLPSTLKISWSERGMQPDKGWNFDVGGSL